MQTGTIGDRRAWRLLAGAFAPMCLFAVLASDARRNRVRDWDGRLLDFLHGYEDPKPFNATADWVINRFLSIGADVVVATLLLVVVAILVVRRHLRPVAFVIASASGVVVLAPVLKTAFDRTSIEAYSRFSFPSGHAMRSMLLAAVLVTLAWPTRWRWLTILASGLFVCALGVALVYEDWHLPSDVVGGWMFAAAWVVLAGVVTLEAHDARSDRFRFLRVVPWAAGRSASNRKRGPDARRERGRRRR